MTRASARTANQCSRKRRNRSRAGATGCFEVQQGSMAMQISQSALERFWSKVEVGDKKKCWLWQSSKDDKGYGMLSKGRNQSPYKAHVLSWLIHFGVQHPSLEVCHACDNPACVNPYHLMLATHQANMLDMKHKQRAPRSPQAGENNNQAKLSLPKVREIRQKFSAGLNCEAISREYSVSASTIRKIARNILWPDPDYTPDYSLLKNASRKTQFQSKNKDKDGQF